MRKYHEYHNYSYKTLCFLLGTLGKVLLSFSIYTNASKILNTTQPSGTLTAVNGIRFVSMTWVVLGHSYAFGLAVGGRLSIHHNCQCRHTTLKRR